MSSNYKHQDLKQILSFLKTYPISSVDAIIQESGAEPLRIYPLLFELAQEKKIRITKETGWGAPQEVELVAL